MAKIKFLKQGSLFTSGNVIQIDTSKVLKKKDHALIQSMSESEQLDFILSKLGKKPKNNVDLRRYKKALISSGADALALKDKEEVLNKFLKSFTLSNHKPKSELKHYGVEIECFIPFQSLGLYSGDYEGSSDENEYVECATCEGSGMLTFTHRDSGYETESDCPACEGSGEVLNEDESSDDKETALQDARIEFSRLVKKHKIKGLNVKDDGSLETRESDLLPLEITLLFPQNDFTQLERLCSLLNELEAKVNESCGLHVHLDQRNEDTEVLVQKRINFESCLYFLGRMVPASRRKNRYCKLQVSGTDRYSAVNFEALEKYNTIEVRLHSATTNFEKISNWCKILSAIEKQVTPLQSKNPPLWSDFLAYIEADQSLKKYIAARVSKFSPDDNTVETDLNESEDNVAS